MSRLPELLAPAGNMDSLKVALHFGADAVYGAMKTYGLRAAAANFSQDELVEAVQLCHREGARFYLTMNIFPFDDELAGFLEAARIATEAGVDAAIVSDLGAISLLRRELPSLPVHVSTQANTVNSEAVMHYAEMGCQRIILARELSLERIAALCRRAPADIQIETFVHGASCMAYSGRCLLSAAMTGRSGNRGACAQSCRWQYALMEMKRPGEYYPIDEDERGTYLLSARDLCLMPLLPDLTSAGVSSLKIEGRMKTEYYVATVVSAYRKALDCLAKSEECFRKKLPELLQELRNASHRDFDTGFLLGAPPAPAQANGFTQEREYVARVEEARTNDFSELVLKNRFHAGEQLELLTPKGIIPFKAPDFICVSTGEKMDTLGIAGERILMKLPAGVSAGDLVRGPVRNHKTAAEKPT